VVGDGGRIHWRKETDPPTRETDGRLEESGRLPQVVGKKKKRCLKTGGQLPTRFTGGEKITGRSHRGRGQDTYLARFSDSPDDPT